MIRRSGSETLPESAIAWLSAPKNSLAVPAVLARPTWARANVLSLATACSKSLRESVARSFSASSRPSR